MDNWSEFSVDFEVDGGLYRALIESCTYDDAVRLLTESSISCTAADDPRVSWAAANYAHGRTIERILRDESSVVPPPPSAPRRLATFVPPLLSHATQVSADASDGATEVDTKFLWRDQSTRLLITVRIAMDAEFIKPPCKKSKLWTLVARKMKAIGGYEVSGTACDEKWRNLQITYKRNKDKKNSSGHEAVSWEFFELMDEGLGGKASTQPAFSQLFSSLPRSETDVAKIIGPPIVDLVADPKILQTSSKSNESAPSKRSAAKSAVWVNVYREQQDKRMKMWEEQKVLEENKIDAINNLASAIARLSERAEP